MRWAMYDIGSNSVKLLVADLKPRYWEVVHEEGTVTRLGRGVAETGSLSAEAIEKTIGELRKLNAVAVKAGVKKIAAVATSAVRDSRNRKEFLRQASEVIGARVRLISGTEEAETIFLGATCNVRLQKKPVVVLDVGGGSVEWVAGQGKKMEKCVSLPLGCVRTSERFVKGYPIGNEVAREMRSMLAGQMEAHLSAPFLRPGATLVATGGTASTLFTITKKSREFVASEIDGKKMSKREIEAAYETVTGLDLSALRQLPGLPPARAEVIGAGIAAILAGLDLLRKSEVTVSLKGLRCGLLQQAARKPVKWKKKHAFT